MLEFVKIQRAFPLYARRAALPGPGARLRAVHLSDLHLEDGFSEGWLRRLVARVNAEEPDIVCFTGDFTCKQPEFRGAARACAILRRIEAPVLAVEGNHDFLGGAAGRAADLMWESGFVVLDNSALTLDLGGARVQVMGLRSLYRGGAAFEHLPLPDGGALRICLAHEPGWANRLPDGYAHAILSGHTHGGQVVLGGIEKTWMPKYWDGFYRGVYETDAGTLVVSAGLGESGPRMRLSMPREFGVLTWGSDE